MKQFVMDGWVCDKMFGKPVQVETTKNGKQYIRFQFSSPESKKTQNGWENVPMYFDCVYWCKKENDPAIACIIGNTERTMIFGQPKWRSYEKDGKKQSAITFNVEQIYTMPTSQIIQFEEVLEVYEDEDIPF